MDLTVNRCIRNEEGIYSKTVRQHKGKEVIAKGWTEITMELHYHKKTLLKVTGYTCLSHNP